MAEAILEFLLVKLTSLTRAELGLFLGFNKDKIKLHSMFTAIKATLHDAEEKQFSDEAIKDWLGKLKDTAYELDDILDEVRSSCLSSFHPKNVVFRYKIARRMKRICERLKGIAEERTDFHLSETVPERSGVTDWRQTSSFTTEPQIYGREEDIKKIVDFFIGDAHASRSEDLSVYPIVGLGGLGKTTVAQLIFNHERVVNHYELRIWVCVSEDFTVKRMAKAIIEAASGHACEDLDLEPLQRRLQDLLQSKRYFLVLDDVWDDEQENWLRLKSVLACGAKGASILVTTRLSKVAAIMGTVAPHELSELSDNDCWKLFKHRAFGPNEAEQEELVVIGKEIIKKCGGVPLAAKALGGLLRFKREEKEWLNVKESNLWSLPEKENSIMPALRLSFLNLPIKLRQCFAYCAIFPKDEIIEKQYLIELWMANGFISSDKRLDAEEVGDGVWNELHWRSFFQDIETDELGKVTTFKMHDLVHDLAQFVAEEVCCVTNDNCVTILSERIHHLSDHRYTWYSYEEADSIKLHQVKSLRTYIDRSETGQLPPRVLKCHSLRVLHFERIGNLSSSIGDLKHLRYLNLSSGFFETLPESLCELWNLQTLKLDRCHRLQKLPDSLVSLKALQRLSLNGCSSLSSLPPQIGKLSSLRHLSMYLVHKESGFGLEELGPLKLKGDLHIKHLGKVKNALEAEEASMSSKQLNKLCLSWDKNEESELQENVEQILELLQPHSQQLQSLILVGYKGAHFPQWMSSHALKYLTYLKLQDCERCLQLPQLGKLPSLKSLIIYNMIHVKYLYEESCDGVVVFSALEYLSLSKLPNLERLSRENGENMFPRLSTLEITACYNFLAEDVLLQGLHSLKKLKVDTCKKFNLSAGFQCLTCLEDLWIEKYVKEEGLHEALQHMTALHSLSLWDIDGLQSLPDCFGNLPLLRQLSVGNCDVLKYLPTSLSLSRLERLRIWNCTILEKRCQKNTGADWSKIAHIPDINFR